MKSGIKTTEFWVGLIVVVLTAFQQVLFPDSPFPAEAFTVLALWVAARLGEKALSEAAPKKRAWCTTEFWVAIGYVSLKYVAPNLLPDALINLVVVFIFGRPINKILEGVGITGLLKKTP